MYVHRHTIVISMTVCILFIESGLAACSIQALIELFVTQLRMSRAATYAHMYVYELCSYVTDG